MAKPILVAAGDTASSHNHNIRPRRGLRPRRPTCGASPSSTLLSILATIVGSSPIYARPTPLPFLCPVLAPKPTSSKTTPRRSRTHTPRSAPLPRSTSRSLPYKFVQGEDGVWRKVGSYTLYGSTVCSESCRETNGAVTTDPLDSTTGLSGSVAEPDTLDEINLSLPPGWYTNTNDKIENRTTLILALSLVLAFFICFLMIGCLFWRKNMRRKHKSGDLEMKARKKKRPTSNPTPHSRSLLIEKETKTQQKLWVRATARWKANARYTARQRRGKRPASVRSQVLDSTATLETTMDHPDQQNTGAGPALGNSSPTLSRQGSCSSLTQSPLRSQDTSSDERQQTIPTSTLSVGPSNNNIPTSPPAYRRRTLVTPIINPSEHLSIPDQAHTSSALISSSNLSSYGGPSETKTPLHLPLEATSSTNVHAAHVATDDKALLARLAELAERPPDESGETSHQISAPEWEDEHPEDFAKAANDAGSDALDSTSQSIFPPPPSKGKMAGPPFYEYPYTFEDFSDSINPEMEPSAPPFEAPGAPVSDDMVMVPSAPPLPNDDETYPETDPRPAEYSGNQEHGGGGGVITESSSTQRPLSQGTLPGYQP